MRNIFHTQTHSLRASHLNDPYAYNYVNKKIICSLGLQGYPLWCQQPPETLHYSRLCLPSPSVMVTLQLNLSNGTPCPNKNYDWHDLYPCFYSGSSEILHLYSRLCQRCVFCYDDVGWSMMNGETKQWFREVFRSLRFLHTLLLYI